MNVRLTVGQFVYLSQNRDVPVGEKIHVIVGIHDEFCPDEAAASVQSVADADVAACVYVVKAMTLNSFLGSVNTFVDGDDDLVFVCRVLDDAVDTNFKIF